MASPTDEPDAKYYNPNPWRVKTVWKPQPAAQTEVHHVEAPKVAPPSKPSIAPTFKADPSRGYTWEPPAPYQPPPPPKERPMEVVEERPHIPEAPPVPFEDDVIPEIPVAPPLPESFTIPKSYLSAKIEPEASSSNANALSMDEFERIRLLSSKSEHRGMDPKLAFSLADDMRQMKGKGGRLFAKRRERAERWTKGDADTSCNTTGPNENVMQKLIMSAGVGGAPVGSHGSGYPTGSMTLPKKAGRPQNRLKEMIDPPKPAMTPWDSAAAYGSTERAFEHLDPYLAMKRGGYQSDVAKSLDLAAQRSYMTPFRPEPVGIPVNKKDSRMPEFSSRIRPWAAG